MSRATNYFIDRGVKTHPDVQVGSLVMSPCSNNLYRVVDERWIRTGNFGSGYTEYLIDWLNAPVERRSSGWVASHIINESCLIS